MSGPAPGAALRREVARDPVHWLAFGFGAGLMPRAPGTWGSLLGLAAGWWLLPEAWTTAGAAWLALALAGVPICGLSARRLGVHDHPGIVFDEIVGMLGVLLVTPRDPAWFLAAFAAFRLFDIAKPWPIREVDHRLRGGAGIMLDDVLAAVYAALVVGLAQRAVAML